MSMTPLRRPSMPRDTIKLARWLLGKVLVRRYRGTLLVGMIVETEAYTTGDAASHAFGGRTPRNGAMFLRRGHAYVYFIYGRYFMLNVSSAIEGVGEAVLIRALEPLSGVPTMRALRQSDNLRSLTNGPGRLAQALAIDFKVNGVDLCSRGALWLAHGKRKKRRIACGTRIGITRNADAPHRFWIADNPFVSV